MFFPVLSCILLAISPTCSNYSRKERRNPSNHRCRMTPHRWTHSGLLYSCCGRGSRAEAPQASLDAPRYSWRVGGEEAADVDSLATKIHRRWVSCFSDLVSPAKKPRLIECHAEETGCWVPLRWSYMILPGPSCQGVRTTDAVSLMFPFRSGDMKGFTKGNQRLTGAKVTAKVREWKN